jgi:hypothetical protein
MSGEQIEKILKSTKVSMEIEGFQISRELEDKGRKLLTGELDMTEYLSDCRRKAWSFGHEVCPRFAVSPRRE